MIAPIGRVAHAGSYLVRMVCAYAVLITTVSALPASELCSKFGHYQRETHFLGGNQMWSRLFAKNVRRSELSSAQVSEALEQRQLMSATNEVALAPDTSGGEAEVHDHSHEHAEVDIEAILAAFNSEEGLTANVDEGAGEIHSELVSLPGVSPEYSVYLQNGEYLPILTDPTDGRLVDSREGGQERANVLGAWDEVGFSDHWEVENASSVSTDSDGLRVEFGHGGADVTLTLHDITENNDLNFGFNDYVQIRLAVPEGYNGDITFSYVTDVQEDFGGSRRWVLPSEEVIADGELHSYRFDVGLEVFWRHSLTDFRITFDEAGSAGQHFHIANVEVGDQPNDVLLLDTDLSKAGRIPVEGRVAIQGKHFATWYHPEYSKRFNPATAGPRAIRIMEEAAQVYQKVLGYVEPFYGHRKPFSRADATPVTVLSAVRKKVNHQTWYESLYEAQTSKWGAGFLVQAHGIWEGDFSPMYHELAHVFQFMQPTPMPAGMKESHANFMAAQFHRYFAAAVAGQRMKLHAGIVSRSNHRQDTPTNAYQDLRLYMALEDAARRHGLPDGINAILWRAEKVNGKVGSVYERVQRLLPDGMTIQDFIADAVSRWPVLDLPEWKEQLDWAAIDDPLNGDDIGSALVPLAAEEGRYRVPLDRAPESYAWMSHELTPTSSEVTVEFKGINVPGEGEGWRWLLVARNDNGGLRYSDIWKPGTQTFRLNPGDSRVVLVAVATPDDLSLDTNHTYYIEKRYDRHEDRRRYPYELQIDGAVPTIESRIEIPEGPGAYHSNPDGTKGGWVSAHADVAPTAYIGRNAMVLDEAKVLESAVIEDFAIIRENATVRGNATVSGFAVVRENALVEANARVRDSSNIGKNAHISGDATIEDNAKVRKNGYVSDNAIVRGNAVVSGPVTGGAIAEADHSRSTPLTDGVHSSLWSKTGKAAQRKPRGLVASYRVEANGSDVLWDEFGSQHGFIAGADVVYDAFAQSHALQFDGAAVVDLDRSVFDLRDSTISAWFKPDRTDSEQTIVYADSDEKHYLKVAVGRNGRVVAAIRVGDSLHQVVSGLQTRFEEWNHVSLSFGGRGLELYVNGSLAGRVATESRPEDVLGANDGSVTNSLLLGQARGAGGFRGRIDDVRFYNVELTTEERENEWRRRGSVTGRFLHSAPMVFDGEMTFETGVWSTSHSVLSVSVKAQPGEDGVYRAIIDSYYASKNNHGNGFGIQDGQYVAHLNGAIWPTGVSATAGEWQAVSLSLYGQVAEFSVDGEVVATRLYSATKAPTQTYRLGKGRADDSWFKGEMKDVLIQVPEDPALLAEREFKVTGPFSLSVDARFDNLAAASGQRLFELGGTSGADDIIFTQHQKTSVLKLIVDRNGVRKQILARNAIVEGETARWTAQVSASGWMTILKNDKPIAWGRGHVPRDVPRSEVMFGRSGFNGLQLTGTVANPLHLETGLNEQAIDVSGPFRLSVDARLDDLQAGPSQTIFDLGNGPRKDNVVLRQDGTSRDMRFVIYRGRVARQIVARDAIVEGETARWAVSVDATGKMKIFKDGRLLQEGQGFTPRDVARENVLFGRSSWENRRPLVGYIGNVEFSEDVETTYNYSVSGPFRLAVNAQFDDLSAAESQHVFFMESGSGEDRVVLNQVGDTNAIEFTVYRGRNSRTITATDAIREGEMARWATTIDSDGAMRIYRDGVLLQQGPGLVPRNVTRERQSFGQSDLSEFSPIIGRVGDVQLVDGFQASDYRISGAFSLAVEARFESLNDGQDQRVFDFGNGSAMDNVILGQDGATNDMVFAVYRGTQSRRIVARNAIKEGEMARWTTSVDESGMMRLYRNGRLLSQGAGFVPRDVDRKDIHFGTSNGTSGSDLMGVVQQVRATQVVNGDFEDGAPVPGGNAVDVTGWDDGNNHIRDLYWTDVWHTQDNLPGESGAAVGFAGFRKNHLSQSIGKKLAETKAMQFRADLLSFTDSWWRQSGQLTVRITQGKGERVVGESVVEVNRVGRGKTQTVSGLIDVSRARSQSELRVHIYWAGSYMAFDNFALSEVVNGVSLMT